MTYFKKCPNCHNTGEPGSTRVVYECEKCGHNFCEKCTNCDRCPSCTFNTTKKAGMIA